MLNQYNKSNLNMVTTMPPNMEEGEVIKSLEVMTLSKNLMDFIEVNKNLWNTFGKMNSHLYRKILMESMEASKLTSEEKIMVFFFASVIKSQPRILKAMDNMPAELKGSNWFYGVKNFFDTKTTQYVSAANRNKKFPVVNIPNCNPGLDILFYCLMTKKEDRSIETLKLRPTFSQINLETSVQTRAKEGYEMYWNNIVKGSKNEDKLEKPQMREEYYQNPASDKYPLLTRDLKIYSVTNNNVGYTMAEVETYLASV